MWAVIGMYLQSRCCLPEAVIRVWEVLVAELACGDGSPPELGDGLE
jgi:hypothetical protein